MHDTLQLYVSCVKMISHRKVRHDPPEAGLVIAYAYLWRREHLAGQDAGLKDRPSVIVLTVERQEDGVTIVTVLPITHSAPTRPGAAVEIPAPVKRHLGLDDQRSWVVVAAGREKRSGASSRSRQAANGQAAHGRRKHLFSPPRSPVVRRQGIGYRHAS